VPIPWAETIQVSQLKWDRFNGNIFNLPGSVGAWASLWKAVHVGLAILGEFKGYVHATWSLAVPVLTVSC